MQRKAGRPISREAVPKLRPPSARTKLSANNCRISRPLVAPIAARIAISRRRPVARVRLRFATFAQPISNTSPTAASNRSKTRLTSPTTSRFSVSTLRIS